MGEEFKSGFVTLIGRTNVGKSTLLNLLVGEKVAAIANKVQTTRTAIKGIVNRQNSQIIFVDTPGIHKPKTKLNETMVETSFTSLTDSDIVLFLIEATSEDIGRGDRIILDKIKESKRKTILIINKIDLVKREKLLNLIDIYSKEYKFEAVIPISATNIKYKEVILEEIEKNLKPGPAYYDIEEYTDQTLRQLAEETIREKALNRINEMKEKLSFGKLKKDDNLEKLVKNMETSTQDKSVSSSLNKIKEVQKTLQNNDLKSYFAEKLSAKFDEIDKKAEHNQAQEPAKKRSYGRSR